MLLVDQLTLTPGLRRLMPDVITRRPELAEEVLIAIAAKYELRLGECSFGLDRIGKEHHIHSTIHAAYYQRVRPAVVVNLIFARRESLLPDGEIEGNGGGHQPRLLT